MDKTEKWTILSIIIVGAGFLIEGLRITIAYYGVIWSGHQSLKYTKIEMLHIWLDGSGTYHLYIIGIIFMLIAIAIFIMFKRYNKVKC